MPSTNTAHNTMDKQTHTDGDGNTLQVTGSWPGFLTSKDITSAQDMTSTMRVAVKDET